jgi:hypothetical protein
VTEAGIAALRLWSLALEQYRSNLDRFFVLYATKHEPVGVNRNLA